MTIDHFCVYFTFPGVGTILYLTYFYTLTLVKHNARTLSFLQLENFNRYRYTFWYSTFSVDDGSDIHLKTYYYSHINMESDGKLHQRTPCIYF